MLSFPLASVREVIARGRADAEAHGGFRNPYYGLRPGRRRTAGALARRRPGRLPSVERQAAGWRQAFGRLCRGMRSPHFAVKRRTFGGDDGVDFIDAEQLEAMMAAAPEATHLRIAFLQDSMQLFLVAKPQTFRDQSGPFGHLSQNP